MAKKRKTTRKGRKNKGQLPAVRAPQSIAFRNLQVEHAKLMEGVRIIMERIESIEARINRLDVRIEPIGDLATLPTKADVDIVKRELRTARVAAHEAHEKIAHLTGMHSAPAGEFTPRAEFFGWKAAIEERMVALERAQERAHEPPRD